MKKSFLIGVLACAISAFSFFPACGLFGGEEASSGYRYDGPHKDKNEDGVCDECNEQVAITFDFYAVNDLHGKFEDTNSQPGVDELSTYFQKAREENENTVVLSSGDMWQGSPESYLTRGGIITEWMNEMDFVSMTLGNHEFDWGEDYIRTNKELAEFPFLAINVYNSRTNKPVDYCQPSVTVEQNGVKIGIIGAIGDCYSSISSEQVEDVEFKNGRVLTTLVKAEAERLRSEGAAFIVYSLHGDFQENGEYDEALSKGYVDLVFEAHTHQGYALEDSEGVYHLQSRGDNGGITHAEATINYVTGKSTVDEGEYIACSKYLSLEDHPVVDTLLEKHGAAVAPMYEALGQNKHDRDNELLSVAAQLYYEAGVEKWSNYDIVLGGGFMKLRSPYVLKAGMVYYGDLINILPFDNQLVLCSISGYNLKNRFLTAQQNYYTYKGAYYQQIKDSIDNNATYYIVTDTYSSQYRKNGLTEIQRYDETTFARDLLAEYIRRGNLA